MKNETISAAALEVLRSLEVSDNLATITAGQLDNDVYAEVNEVLSRLGGKWNRSKEGHVFEKFPHLDFAAYLETGELPPKNPLAYFPTPAPVVESVFTWVDLKCPIGYLKLRLEDTDGRKPAILEPSAGRGALIDPILAEAPELRDCITAIEKDAKHIPFLKARGVNVAHADFLTWKPDDGQLFDLIVMNPPFKGTTWAKHVRRAWELLAPRGALVAVVPEGLRMDREMHFWACRNGSMEDLGRGQFKACGTNVGTCIIALRKEEDQVKPTDGFRSPDAWQTNLLASQEQWFISDLSTKLAKRVTAGECTLAEVVAPIVDGVKRIASEALRQDIAIELSPEDIAELAETYIANLSEYTDGLRISEEQARAAVLAAGFNPLPLGQLEMAM